MPSKVSHDQMCTENLATDGNKDDSNNIATSATESIEKDNSTEAAIKLKLLIFELTLSIIAIQI
jgi:hypothetical protein